MHQSIIQKVIVIPDKEYTAALIETKLHKPPLPVDLVPRPRLTEWLERHRKQPLTLVSAAAGYGKSTIISCWLESADSPAAWVSLDEHDNDLGEFLHYFLAAIQTVFPNALPETQASLTVTPLPPVVAIAKTLINEISQIEQPFILVLDDYHVIETQTIHDLLRELLLHPPRNLHLVLCTRVDPPLPLVTYRANSQMTEIRTQDLRFNQKETALLLDKILGAVVDRSVLFEMDAQAEGWVTGLRLAALAMRHRIGQDPLQREFSIPNRYVTEYLVTEILAKQATTLSECMLKTSILDRLCAGLCDVLCFPKAETSGNGSGDSDFSGEQFLEWLQASNLFVIPLDAQNEWFRYHHLFREFLQHELTRRLGPDEIAQLHADAGRWYAKNGWVEEALQQLLLADHIPAAIELVARHRYGMLNNTQWPRLERWLNLFPPEVIETSAELWMLKTWFVYHRGQWSELPALIEYLTTMLADGADQETIHRLDGEIYSLRSLIAYHRGDALGTISHARKALELLPDEMWIARVLARAYLGGGLLLTGDAQGGYQAYYGAFAEEKVQSQRFMATLLITACSFHWLTADLHSMELAAKQSIALCQEIDFRQILGHAKQHLGIVRYHQNDLSAAEVLFNSVVASPYQNYGRVYINSACGLALTYQAQGREVEAREVAEDAIAFLLETGTTAQLPFILALQAEIALIQGNLPAARQWAEKLDPVPPLVPMQMYLAPHVTLAKVWLAQDTPASRVKAADLLKKLEDYLEYTHNTRFLIETLALQAMLEQAEGDHSAASAKVERALKLAQPGGFIRLFVDLGSPMAHLFSRLDVDSGLQLYVDQIRSAFPGSQVKAASISTKGLLEPLTNREMEVLELLGERLTNKEIAAQLVIAPGTVKGHTINIYQKLNVKGRRQAVEKAIALGILFSK